MKLGILTFQHTLNYGAELQAYALQATLQKLGYEAEVICYYNPAVEQREFPQSLFSIQGMKNRVKYVWGRKKRARKAAAFRNFEEKHLNLSSKTYTRENISEADEFYDAVVAGSDQIWNSELTGEDTTYFLDFLSSSQKKLSYAASFGADRAPTGNAKQMGRLLSDFSLLTVREKAGASIVERLTGRLPAVAADPTLLLRAEDWDDIASDTPDSEPYLLIYLPHHKKEVFSFARRLAKEQRLKIKYVNITGVPLPGAENLFSAGPTEFVSLVKHAAWVVTGSFHGTAFAVNYGINFYSENSRASAVYGSRISSLLDLLGLSDRVISDQTATFEPVDYGPVREKLAALRESSLDLLRRIGNGQPDSAERGNQ